MDGILNINKPLGKTSFGIVSLVRRLSGERRVGHAGTLDPEAMGVLPVCLGRGTRIVEFLMGSTKTYHATVEFGITTDTYDGAGQITGKADPGGIDRGQLVTTLELFRGRIRQIPPMYSAIKHQGQPLYKLARAGIHVERKSRPVVIHQLELISWEPPLATLEVECSKGTYIRSLAHDLGRFLGCGAYLKGLVRTRYGIFDIKDSVTVPSIEEAFRYGYWERFIYPIDIVLQHQDAIVVDEQTEDNILKGIPVALEDTGAECPAGLEQCRVYTRDGRFLGVLTRVPGKDLWQPDKVFP